MDAIKKWAITLKHNISALYCASRDPRVPFLAKLIIVLVVAYALSPIDLIPDFIPIIGYLDDLLLLPAGIWVAMRLIPAEVWADCHAMVTKKKPDLPVNRYAAVVIVLVWLSVLFAVTVWAWHYIKNYPGMIDMLR